MRRESVLKSFARSWVWPFLNPYQIWSIVRLPFFFVNWQRFVRQGGTGARFVDLWPCLADATANTAFDPHYFFQAAWLARHLEHARPLLHVDVGSSIGLLGVLSAQRRVLFLDIRPLKVHLPGLNSLAADIMSLPFADASISSLSSLHVVEHVGLGRYGDPMNPSGHLRALSELARVLAPGGKLYLSVPVGRERVCFNAHRIFAPETILSAVPALKLVDFSLVTDDGRFHDRCSLSSAQGLDYGCGMFTLTK